MSEKQKNAYWSEVSSLQRDGIYPDEPFKGPDPKVPMSDEEMRGRIAAEQNIADSNIASHQEWLKKMNSYFKKYIKNVADRVSPEYVESVPRSVSTSGSYSADQKKNAYIKLIRGFVYNDKDVEQGVKNIEMYLNVLSDSGELLTDLINDIFNIVYKMRSNLYQNGYNSLRKGTPVDGVKLINYLIIITTIIEKGYSIDRSKLRNIKFFMPDNPYVNMPLEVAIGYLTDTIINNTHVQNKNVPNPVNLASGVFGEDYIDVQKLSDLAIVAYHTGHRLSDDKKNFPREKRQDVLDNRVSNVKITDIIPEFDNSWGTRRNGETIFKYKYVYNQLLMVGYNANDNVITYISFGGFKGLPREPYPEVIEKLKEVILYIDNEEQALKAFEEGRLEQAKRGGR